MKTIVEQIKHRRNRFDGPHIIMQMASTHRNMESLGQVARALASAYPGSRVDVFGKGRWQVCLYRANYNGQPWTQLTAQAINQAISSAPTDYVDRFEVVPDPRRPYISKVYCGHRVTWRDIARVVRVPGVRDADVSDDPAERTVIDVLITGTDPIERPDIVLERIVEALQIRL